MRYHGDYNPFQVNSVWEVRLRPEIVNEIKLAAQKYHKSMSWIVRYCTFRLYRKGANVTKLHEMAENLREKNQPNPLKSNELYRLRVCFYGDDERILLELKYHFKLTVTMLIRIALKLYLGQLSSFKVPFWEFFWFGLKFFEETKITYSRKYEIPQVDFHFKRFLCSKSYWATPPGPLPTFVRP